ncbi:AarF/ABC1/UbiB kinase family protein [Candidatus Woesearchaeota archaeon]|nr:AarF/ABC1/UbiB kinase family protein [Candidatus Woesearchaeota archaeon]
MATRLQDIKRASKVINACAKHGLDYFVHTYGFGWHLPFLKRIHFGKHEFPESIPQKIRAVMEELGGAYIKLGQLLSMRPDLIPPEYCEEFKRLRDDTTPLQFSTIKSTIEKEFRQPIQRLFKTIEKTPLGSASVAQVHKATLHNGKNVVIKIQRPNLKQQFEEDTDILYYLAHKIEQRLKKNTFNPIAIIQEFERYTKNELNFVIEATNIDKFYHNFKDSKTIIIPKVHWLYTKTNILVIDYLDGTKLSEAKKLSTKDKKIIAERIMDASLKQLFEYRTFHADLHPGNILVMQNNTIGLLDFGIVGTLSQEQLNQMLRVYANILNNDTDQVVETLLSIGQQSTTETNIEAFKADITNIMQWWYGVAPEKIRITQLQYHLFQTCVKHHINIASEFILFGKSAMTSEGTCIEINPDFNFVQHAQPKIIQLLRKQHTPFKLAKQFLQNTTDTAKNIAALPKATVGLINKLQREPIKIGIDQTDIRHLGFDVNTSSNRLAYALLIASLIISGSLLINIGPSYKDYSILSIMAYISAGIFFLPFIVSVLREGTTKYDVHNG